MKLSIIIPVYNVERYIKTCLESIYVQGLSENDFEVIRAQYLSRNPNKVVISPDKWFPHQVKDSKLIQEGFVCLQTTNQINEK